MANLAVIDPEAAAWTQARLDLIKKTICHPSMSEGEVALFLEQCKRTGADPMIGEAFCVPRRVKITVQGKEQWVDKYGFQMSEEGMASRCSRFPDFKGIKFGAFYEKDEFVISETSGDSPAEILHVYKPSADRGRLRGAWAIVQRAGFVFSPEVLYLEEYEQRNHQGEITKAWQKRVTMILKCARAAARRRAYSTHFAGVYATEELQLEDVRRAEEEALESVAAATSGAPSSTADQVRAKIEARRKSLGVGGTAPTLKPAQVRVTVAAPAQKAAAAPKASPPPPQASPSPPRLVTEEEPPTVDQVPVEQPPPPDQEAPKAQAFKLSFGPFKDKALADLSTDDLIAVCALAEEQLGKATGKEGWFEKVKSEAKLCEEELNRREAQS